MLHSLDLETAFIAVPCGALAVPAMDRPARQGGGALHGLPARYAFAKTLRRALQCLHHGLDELGYNFVIRSAALESGRRCSIARTRRWYHSRAAPRCGCDGGFEFSTGVNPHSASRTMPPSCATRRGLRR